MIEPRLVFLFLNQLLSLKEANALLSPLEILPECIGTCPVGAAYWYCPVDWPCNGRNFTFIVERGYQEGQRSAENKTKQREL